MRFSYHCSLRRAGLVVLALAATMRVSVGSLAMVASMPIWLWLLDAAVQSTATAAVLAAAVVFTHRANIRRLAHGEEPALGERIAGAGRGRRR